VLFPTIFPGRVAERLKKIFESWSTDSTRLRSQRSSGECGDGKQSFPDTSLSGADSVQRPNVIPGVPFYLYPSSAPGGKVINAAAFTTPVPATAQGNLGRNALRGFGASAVGLDAASAVSLHRTSFSAGERRCLQHSESPELRQPDQLPQLTPVRPSHHKC